MLSQLELRHLYAAVVLADELNFTRAAHRLRITQPALSKQIMQLEKQYRFRLFIRDRKNPAQLTEAGRTFVHEARRALLHAERAVRMARAAHRGYQSALPQSEKHHLPISHQPATRLPSNRTPTGKA